MARKLRLFSSVVAASALRPLMTAAGTTRPPVARREPHTVKFGRVAGENRGADPMPEPIELQDDLFWLRDDTRSNEEILGLLREENAYTEACTDHLDDFRGALYDEMLSHVQEDDDTYPSPRPDGFEYWSRTVKGKSFRQYLRRPVGGGADEMVLDVNEVPTLAFFERPGWDAAQCDVHAVEPSPSGETLAFSVDGSGYETYAIRLRDLRTGAELAESVEGTGGGVAWAGEKTFFYEKLDAQHRPFQVWRHAVGTAQTEDTLVYEESDEKFLVSSWTSRDGSLVFIQAESKETTEARFVPTADPAAPPTLIRPRAFGVRYDVDSHAPSRRLFLTSNADGCVNRRLLVASLDAPAEWAPAVRGGATGGAEGGAPVGGGAEGGVPVLPHSAARSLDGVAAFDDFVVVAGREEGFTQLWVVPLDGGAEHRMAWEAEAFTAGLGGNELFAAGGRLRVSYTSMTAPRQTLEYDVAGRTYEALKVQPVPGYDASLYRTKRLEVAADDGERIPLTLLWRADAVADGAAAPCHLYGYGSYGICIDPSFAASRLALVDRGVVYAIAHVRGGGEMGHHRWYEEAGKYLRKRNTFTDFVACARHLLGTGVARRGALSCEGRSAGGLLMGNVVNMAPELFCASVAGVPFVDLMVTMCDPSIPLTTEEWEEWGNPNEAAYYEYMRSYSPIDNVRAGARYPPMLIVSGLNDPRVAYWEPAKWAQVLRATVANGDDVLLKMDLAAGHFSAADRYRYLRELAFDYAWLLDRLGRADQRADAATPAAQASQ